MRALAGVGGCLIAPLLLARLFGRLHHRRSLHTVERRWAKMLTGHLKVRMDVRGLEHIVLGTSYIVTPLHEGLADALAVLHLPLDLRFVARDELFSWPFFGGLLRDTEQISICPEQGMRSYLQVRRQAPPVLAGGESVVVFPQGSILGIEIEFKRGPFALALALDRPILPVAITGSHRIWEHPFSPRLRYGQRVSLQVLPPVYPADYRLGGVDALRDAVQQRLKDAALGGEMAAPRRFVPSRDGYWDGFSYTIDPQFTALRDDVEGHRHAARTAQQWGSISAGSSGQTLRRGR